METVRGFIADVKFDVPSDLTNATYDVTYGTSDDTGDATVADGVATVTLPYASVVNLGTVTVELDFTYQGNDYTLTKTLEVVNPMLELWELKNIVSGKTDDELWELESVVRHIIEAFCGQSFSGSTKTVNVAASGGNILYFNERLDDITNITVNGNILYDTGTPAGAGYLGQNNYILTNGGWSLQAINYPMGQVEIITTTGPIYDPLDTVVRPFCHGQTYQITGTWGWSEAPSRVKEAARLLVNDYACADAAYRNKYLVSMSAGDWQLEFSPDTYQTTGNATADQLLGKYRRRGWAVL